MGAATANWNRWVFASLAKHLHTAASAAQLPLAIETLDDRTKAFINAQHKCEVTITGPHTREMSPKLHRIWVELFVVITSNLGGSENAGVHRDKCGAIHSALDRSIEVRQYDKDNLSSALVGCLSPRIGVGDAITDNQLRASDSDKQATSVIEAKFEGFFTQP